VVKHKPKPIEIPPNAMAGWPRSNPAEKSGAPYLDSEIIADWIDMPFVLQGIEGELRNEVLAIALETMANVHQNIADGTRKVASTIRGAQE
jgi:hypothetical protein